jgi:hypothetical protein
MPSQARSLTPVPARVFYLFDALSVRRKRTPFPMTHVTETGVVIGLTLTVCFWAGVAVGVWALFH